MKLRFENGFGVASAFSGPYPLWKRKHRRPHSRSPGFTLIELLVVVSIIALLISILLPSLNSARQQAKLVRCLSNQRGLGQSSAVFAADRKNLFQLCSSQTGMVDADGSKQIYAYDDIGELYAWPVALSLASGSKEHSTNWKWGVRADSYTAAYNIRDRISPEFESAVCPSDEIRIASPFYPRGSQLLGTGDPNFPQSGGGNMSYWGELSFAINEDISGNEVPDVSGSSNPACWKDDCRGEFEDCAGYRLRGNLDRVFDPGSCMLFIDAGPDSSDDSADIDGYANLITSAKANGPYLEDVQNWTDYTERIPTNRHPKKKLNVIFADFHGSTVQPTEFYTSGSSKGLPSKYSTTVRVSPYKPWVEGTN